MEGVVRAFSIVMKLQGVGSVDTHVTNLTK
jgi:hypothetical protein